MKIHKEFHQMVSTRLKFNVSMYDSYSMLILIWTHTGADSLTDSEKYLSIIMRQI